jgi:hypothetical protein
MRKLAAASVVFIAVVAVVVAVAMSQSDDTATPATSAAPATPATPAAPATPDQDMDDLADLVDFEQLLDEMHATDDPEQFEAADRVLKTLPESKIAGAWVDPETGRFTVGVTDQSIESAVTDGLESRGVEDAVVAVVEHSQAELDRIIDGVYDLPGMDDISSGMHDYASNRVVLTSSAAVTKALRRKVYDYFGDAAAIASEPLDPSAM